MSQSRSRAALPPGRIVGAIVFATSAVVTLQGGGSIVEKVIYLIVLAVAIIVGVALGERYLAPDRDRHR